MTDTPDPTHEPLDVDAEQEKLDHLGEEIEAARRQADADLEVGGEDRVFADSGVREQVAETGDTDHPTGDGTGEDA